MCFPHFHFFLPNISAFLIFFPHPVRWHVMYLCWIALSFLQINKHSMWKVPWSVLVFTCRYVSLIGGRTCIQCTAREKFTVSQVFKVKSLFAIWMSVSEIPLSQNEPGLWGGEFWLKMHVLTFQCVLRRRLYKFFYNAANFPSFWNAKGRFYTCSCTSSMQWTR